LGRFSEENYNFMAKETQHVALRHDRGGKLAYDQGMTQTHEDFIRQSIELAKEAAAAGNDPFGALLVHNGRVLLTAVNTVGEAGDVTRHAELNLVSAASRELDAALLAESVLYTSTEPCAMCSGAIFWAGIGAVVYSCGAAELERLFGGGLGVSSRDILEDKGTAVIGPILPEEGLAVHRRFRRESRK
jgi:tRNA(Arg) A34 adenosine deaminase TadA